MIPEKLLERAMQKGSDSNYQSWVRKWPSVLTKSYSEFLHGEGRCEYSHVRRVSHGSGMAHKPEYSGLPLTHDEHSLTHNEGESAFYPAEWWEQQAITYLTMWINGVQPPPTKEASPDFSESFYVTSAGHVTAFRLLLEKHFKNPKAKPITITIETTKKKRTTQQNKAQWGCIYRQLVDFYTANPLIFARDMVRSMRFGLDVDSIHEMCKRLFNNGESTRTNTVAHSGYFKKIQHYFLHKYQHEINPPIKEDGNLY